ncbi:hypothetical protein MKW94_014356, partial [Papaver nudicaule]|nr:hypothetical protein [Papaver nudicaule]
IASSLVQQFPELVIDQTKKVQTKAMNDMAGRPFAFASGAKHTFWQRRVYPLLKVDIQTIQRNSSLSSGESLPQILEGTDADIENPVERIERSYTNKEYPPGNSEKAEGDKAKPRKPETVGDKILFGMVIVCFEIHRMIKFFFVFLVFLLRFIWTP